MIDTFKGKYEVSCKEYNGYWVVRVEIYKDTVIEVTEEGIVYTDWSGYEKLKGREKAHLLIDVGIAIGEWYKELGLTDKKYRWKFREDMGFGNHLSTNIFNYNEVNDIWFMDKNLEEQGFKTFFREERFTDLCAKLGINRDFFKRVL